MIKRPRGPTLATFALALLVAAPLLVVASALLAPASESWPHIREHLLAGYLQNTALLLLGVALLSAFIGIPTAWLCAARTFPGVGAFRWLLALPLAAPAYVIAYVYTDLLEYAGPVQSALRSLTGWGPGDYWFPSIRSLGGAVLVLALTLYPYVYLLCRSLFEQQAGAQLESARVLGASGARAFWRVVLPAARPAIAGGLALVMMETAADFGVVEFFGVPTFATGIFRAWFGMGDQAAALQLAAGLLAVALLLVLLERMARRGKVGNPLSRSRPLPRTPLTGGSAVAATALCALPVLFGFALPAGILLYYALTVGDPLFGARFARLLGNSAFVAGTTAALAVIAALLLCYAERQRPLGRPLQGAVRLATLGYALPGAMLALGVLSAFSSADQALAQWRRDLFGGQPTLWLTGSVAALVFAYLVRFLTVAYNACHGGFEKISPRLDEVSRTLGAGPRRVLTRVHWPLLRPAALTGALLVFIDVLKELPATLILRPFNFDTLATRVYQLAADERLPQAATAALVLIVLGTLQVLLVNRRTQAATGTEAPQSSPSRVQLPTR
ncbi:MAG: iron ABC transporter permease [Pseudomonadota bacterium]